MLRFRLIEKRKATAPNGVQGLGIYASLLPCVYVCAPARAIAVAIAGGCCNLALVAMALAVPSLVHATRARQAFVDIASPALAVFGREVG